MSDHADLRHYVYRFFDADGQLIYVGCTHKPEQRIAIHQYTMWWAPQIARTKIKVYADKASARAAEAEAIRNERPRWNVLGKWVHMPSWSKAEFDDYITALELHPNYKTRYRLAHIARAKHIHGTRYATPQPEVSA